MKSKFLFTTILLLVLLGLPNYTTTAQDEPGEVTRTYALENVHVIPRPGQMIQNATVVIQDGLIHSLGRGISIPSNAKMLKADTMYVYAGFIDGLSYIGVPKPKEDDDDDRGNRGNRSGNRDKDPGNPTNERAGITPEKSVREVFNPSEKSINDFRNLGFTAAHVVPRGKMLPGSGAIVFLDGEKTTDALYKENVSTFGQLKGAGGVFPSTIIAVMTKWRELYKQAQQAAVHTAAYAASPSGMKRPAYDEATLAMIPVTKKQSRVFMYAENHLAVHRAMILRNDLGFNMTLAGLQNGWRLADKIRASNIPVLLSLDLPKEKKEDEKKKKDKPETKTKWDVERDTLTSRQKREIKTRVRQAAVFEGKGIPFGFTTEGTTAKNFKSNLTRMIKEGLGETAALAALTTNPAAILGVQQSMGTVEKGKIANIVVTDKPYFEEKSNVRYVFVDGNLHEYEIKEKKKKKGSGDVPTDEAFLKVLGTWSYSIDAMGQVMKGELEIYEEDGSLVATMTGEQMGEAAEIDEILLEDDEMSFSAELGDGFEIELTATIGEDEFEGNVKAGDFGTFPISASRTSTPD